MDPLKTNSMRVDVTPPTKNPSPCSQCVVLYLVFLYEAQTGVNVMKPPRQLILKTQDL